MMADKNHQKVINRPKIMITGAGGFLGSEIAKQGLARGYEVIGVARGHYPQLEDLGVDMRRGDIAEEGFLLSAAQGCEAIFHVAAKAGAWGDRLDYERTNVQGTVRVINACQKNEISKLIYTSSPSVVHAGEDIEGADESLPYPSSFIADYPRTKAEAERLVLESQCETLNVVALRPHLIWGPGDRHLIPRLLDRARRGKLKYLAPHKLVDSVYIEDAARAHWNAFDRLCFGAECAGQAYFITQDEPWPIVELIEGILKAHSIDYPRQTLSPRLALFVGGLLEKLYGILRIKEEPIMTRFIAEQLSTAHWFNIDRAKRDLGYAPARTMNEALEELKQSVESKR